MQQYFLIQGTGLNFMICASNLFSSVSSGMPEERLVNVKKEIPDDITGKYEYPDHCSIDSQDIV